MTFQDDPQTTISGNTYTVNDSYDVVSVRFQMRSSELETIASGTEAEKDTLIAWLLTAAE
jgi:hypothetical protein